MPRFEEIVYEFANNYQQAGINNITDELSQVVCDELERDDGGGQAQGVHGGEDGCIQVHGESRLEDRHHWGQVRERLGGNDPRPFITTAPLSRSSP